MSVYLYIFSDMLILTFLSIYSQKQRTCEQRARRNKRVHQLFFCSFPSVKILVTGRCPLEMSSGQ